jgi:hypothetical protein
MEPVFTPPPLRLSPTIDDMEQLGVFLSKRYNTPFKYDDELGLNTYHIMYPYSHIYEFNTGRPYIIKFSSDPIHKGLIQHEWTMYQELYTLDTQSYLIQGVEGGEFKGCS